MADENLTGQILGDYKILEFVSSGGMGSVYKACHKDDPETIMALKVIKQEFSSNEGFISRFKHERRQMLKLSDPHIVLGRHFGEDNGRHYLIMDYIEGESLRDRLNREPGKRLSVKATVAIAAQLSSALAHAHDMGVIHRDIKPENILLRKSDGAALLTDFGLMKAIGEQNYLKSSFAVPESCLGSEAPVPESCLGSEDGAAKSPTGSKKSSTSGTLAYMSPEQMEGQNITSQSDIFQLGVVLYECLTGERPHGAFESPTQINLEVSLTLDKVILKCLKAKVGDRYYSSAELNESIKKCDGATGVYSSPRSKYKLWFLLLCGIVGAFFAAPWAFRTLFPGGGKTGESVESGIIRRDGGSAQVPADTQPLVKPVPNLSPREGMFQSLLAKGEASLAAQDAVNAVSFAEEAIEIPGYKDNPDAAFLLKRSREAVFTSLLSKGEAALKARKPANAVNFAKKAMEIPGYKDNPGVTTLYAHALEEVASQQARRIVFSGNPDIWVNPGKAVFKYNNPVDKDIVVQLTVLVNGVEKEVPEIRTPLEGNVSGPKYCEWLKENSPVLSVLTVEADGISKEVSINGSEIECGGWAETNNQPPYAPAPLTFCHTKSKDISIKLVRFQVEMQYYLELRHGTRKCHSKLNGAPIDYRDHNAIQGIKIINLTIQRTDLP